MRKAIEMRFGEHIADAVRAVADDVRGVVIPGAGHFVALEAPEEMLAALGSFLATYPRCVGRMDGTGRPNPVRLALRAWAPVDSAVHV